jgi:hypothetical protein
MNSKDILDLAREIGPSAGLLLSAVGLGLNGVGLLRSARVARNTFMLQFYDRVQNYNPIHVYLKSGWPDDAPGPASPEQWNEVARYMGLFEGLWRLMLDKTYPRDRADSDYSHRIIVIVLNPQIRQKFLDNVSDESGGWGDFIELWRCLESCHVYRLITADLLKKKGVVVPKSPRPLASHQHWWHWRPRNSVGR